MDRLVGVLTDLSRSDQETEAAINQLTSQLCSQPEARAALRRAEYGTSAMSALLGILRSSQSAPLLAGGASCLATLAYDSPETAAWLESRDIISVLLPLLFPQPTPSSRQQSPQSKSTLSWQPERLPVYVSVLQLLCILTYHSLQFLVTLGEEGGVKLLVALATSPQFIASCSSFSTEAQEVLVSAALGRKLICHALATPNDIRDDVMRGFPSVGGGTSLNDSVPRVYPSYLVELLYENGDAVSEVMVASGEVWRSLRRFPVRTEPVWTSVMVTSVENGGHVWCQFCSDIPKPRIATMAAAIREIPPPSSPSSIIPPVIGQIYLAYFDPQHCHAPSCISTPIWGRGRLLGVEPDNRLRLLSLDYGVSASLPTSHLLPLPPQCKGVPPLAIPCKLVGIVPIPVCTVVQESVAGILRNLAFEQSPLQREIITFGGIEALIELSLSCDVGVAEEALAALTNMTDSLETREEVGERGAMETLLDLILQPSPPSSLLLLALSLLYTLTTHCPKNLKRLHKLNSSEKLHSHLSQVTSLEEEQLIISLLKELNSYPTNTTPINTSPIKRTSMEVGVVTRCSPNRKLSCSSGKKCDVYRCLGDEETCITCDDVIVMSDDGGGCEGGGGEGVSGGVVTTHIYSYNELLPFGEDSTHVFREVSNLQNFSPISLQRCICGIMNTGKSSTLYLGVAKSGRVRGIQLDRKDRDNLAMDVDRVMLSLTPPVKHHRYKVLYVPVSSAPSNSHVLQLEIAAGNSREIYTANCVRSGQKVKMCYYRHGNTDMLLSQQDLRNTLALQISSCHDNEISSLVNNIKTLQVTLDQLNIN